MDEIVFSAILGSIVGAIGTGLGGVAACILKKSGEKVVVWCLGASAGIMLSVTLLSMVPEAVQTAGIPVMLIGLVIGAVFMALLHKLLPHDMGKNKEAGGGKSRLRSLGLMLCLGVAIHNFPEGLAVGAGMESSAAFSFTLALLIMLHDIPEGLAMALPMSLGGMKSWKCILLTAASGLPMALGAVVGNLLGHISMTLVGGSIAFAAGAMLYLTLWDMIPETKTMSTMRIAWITLAIGFAIGAAIVFLT